jgi:NAD(P)-dependent dehydrogenase (short-subunit alcohol dehydrogenase family)/thioesterase domain-containing protein/acyl carrier protein
MRSLDPDRLQAPSPHAGGLLGLEWTEIQLPERDTDSLDVETRHCKSPGGPPAEASREAAKDALAAVQRWLADESKADSRLALITKDAMATKEGERPDLAAAAIWGLVRSAQSEHPGRFALIDADGSDASEAALSAALALGADEPQIALREGVALAPRVARISVEEEAEIPLIDLERTVLITGGTGGLGALVARHLAQRHDIRHLLLLSRRGSEAMGAKELKQELEELGAKPVIAACDVADRKALEGILESIPSDHPLGAVIHCAGALADGTVEAMQPEQIEPVFASKADSAWNLHELTKDLDLSAFVLFSSVAGILGGPGQANYAAANVYLDALAQRRRAEDLPAVSIAWGLWERASGMTSQLTEADLARIRRGGFEAISDERGLALFDLALGADRAQVLGVPLNLPGLRAIASAGALAPIFSGMVRMSKRRASASNSLAAKLTTLTEAERQDHVLEMVRGEAAFLLGFESAKAVEPDQPFLELGFDSLAAVELRNRLNAVFGLNLGATAVFDHPTSAELAAHLLGALATGTVEKQPAETFRWLLREAAKDEDWDVRREKLTDVLDMIERAGELRNTFDEPLAGDDLPEAVVLADGPASPSLLMPPTIVNGSAREFAQFAQQFKGERRVLGFSLPGFVEGEPPGSPQLAIQTQVDAILRLDLDSDFAMVSHSSGGWLAVGAASRLEAMGKPPIAVVLIDTFLKAGGKFLKYTPEMMAAMWTRDTLIPFDDVRLTAMHSYGSTFADWLPPEIDTPVVAIRAGEPPPGLAQESEGDWSESWPPWSTGITVPGNHFSMVVEHAETTAQAIREAIGVEGQDKQQPEERR